MKRRKIEGNTELNPVLFEELKKARLFGAVTDTRSSKFVKFLMQPKTILRNGWLLDPNVELGQRSERSYIIGSQPGETRNPLGQKLTINRAQRRAILKTYIEDKVQEISVDLESFKVVENQVRFSA